MRNKSILPRVPRVLNEMCLPQDTELSKYSNLFTDFNSVPEIWESQTPREAWTKLYATLSGASSDQQERIRSIDGFGLARLSSNLEISRILKILPDKFSAEIASNPKFKLSQLEEIFVYVGMRTEVRGGNWMISLDPSTKEDIKHVRARLPHFGHDGRTSLPGTLHRIAVYKGKNSSEPFGFTFRIGKYLPGVASALVPVARKGSLLIMSRPSVGKTTLLRDLAVRLSQLPGNPRVVVVDTSCEIAGDCDTPLPFMHRVRRMHVNDRRQQGQAMIEVLQNHSSDYIIVDEISNLEEAEAAYTITQRGVKLIATCHAENLSSLLQNNQLNRLVGGVAQAFLSNEERRMRGKVRKVLLERSLPSPFSFCLELPTRGKGNLFTNVNVAVDKLLEDGPNTDLASVTAYIDLDKPLPVNVVNYINGNGERRVQKSINKGNNANSLIGANNSFNLNRYKNSSDRGNEDDDKDKPTGDGDIINIEP